jgi:hypothetical protein
MSAWRTLAHSYIGSKARLEERVEVAQKGKELARGSENLRVWV